MKIFFNYQIFYQQKFGGISNYFYHLNNSLNDLDVQTEIIAPLHINNYLKKINKGMRGKHIYFPSKLSNCVKFFNEKISKNYINTHKPDIVHDTYYFPAKYNYHNKFQKRVCTVYDMINEIFSKNSKYENTISKIKKNTINESDHIFCISNQTKKDLIDLFNIDEKKISVTYLASSLKKKKFLKIRKKNLKIVYYLLEAEVVIKILIIF